MRWVPDWLIYAVIIFLIYLNATRASQDYIPDSPPAPELGDLLPLESPRDPAVMVEIENPESGVGTAFAIDDKGTWLTARHVVDGCSRVALKLGTFKAMRIDTIPSEDSDSAVLTSSWKRKPLPTDLDTRRQIGEHGYFFGFPQGKPGEAVGALLGRHKLIVRGRYNTEEPILAWTELGRTRGLNGSLGGLSGGPVLDKDGEVIGIVAAESPRRGRLYTVAPRTLRELVPEGLNLPQEPIDTENYGSSADSYRRQRRIAQVLCLVK